MFSFFFRTVHYCINTCSKYLESLKIYLNRHRQIIFYISIKFKFSKNAGTFGWIYIN